VIERKNIMDSNIKNNMESNLSRADKEKFKNMISKIRENILEFKEYFFIGDNNKVFVVRSIRRSRFCIFNNNIK
jgi:hypothetical protein